MNIPCRAQKVHLLVIFYKWGKRGHPIYQNNKATRHGLVSGAVDCSPEQRKRDAVTKLGPLVGSRGDDRTKL